MTLSSKASRSRYSSTVRPGATPWVVDPALEPGLRALAQLRRLVDRGAAFADREARQDRRLHARPEGATLGDLDRRGDRLRQIREQLGHFGAGLETVLGRELAPVGLDHQPSFGDANERVMRLVVLALGEERLVGGDERDAARIGELDERRLGGAFGGGAVALQLDVEPVAEQTRQRLAAPARQTALTGDDRGIERPARASGQRNQAIGLALQPSELEMRLLVRRCLEKCARIEPHQAAVTALARGQENDARAFQDGAVAGARAGLVVGEIQRQRAADDRLDAGCPPSCRRIRAPRTCCRCR